MLSPKKENKEHGPGWVGISWWRKERHLLFLWIEHFKETHMWAGFHQRASFSSWSWLAPSQATVLMRSCWKEAVFQGRGVFLGLEEEGFFMWREGWACHPKLWSCEEAETWHNPRSWPREDQSQRERPRFQKPNAGDLLVLVQLENWTQKFSWIFSFFALFYYKSPTNTHICLFWLICGKV